MTLANQHRSILSAEIIAAFKPQAGDYYLDATLGDGGHTSLLLGHGAKVVALDQDDDALTRAYNRLQEDHPGKKIYIAANRPLDKLPDGDCWLVKANFADMSQVAANLHLPLFSGILFDLGVSTHQLLEADRGFSFNQSGPLDMRMDRSLGVTAADLINALSESELADLIFTLGDEPRSKIIAKRIVEQREQHAITTTTQLATIIAHNAPTSRVHPATKVFQALRMAVNLERDSLTRALPSAVALLKKHGILAIISFHSGEDRIVKHFLAQEPTLKATTPKPLVPTVTEVKSNPRSRSAKLRLAQKQ